MDFSLLLSTRPSERLGSKFCSTAADLSLQKAAADNHLLLLGDVDRHPTAKTSQGSSFQVADPTHLIAS